MKHFTIFVDGTNEAIGETIRALNNIDALNMHRRDNSYDSRQLIAREGTMCPVCKTFDPCGLSTHCPNCDTDNE